MSVNNMYCDSIAVLLQAILTQACRVILAFALVRKPEKLMYNKLDAKVCAHLSETEASSLIEGAGKHALLTAVHLLSCEQRPHLACQHHNGELALAVSAILDDFPLRSNIITALTKFIMRKWECGDVTIHYLLSRAVLVGPRPHTVTSTVVDYRSAPIALLLHVYPDLACTGSVSEVSCGCTHQWFRETLPLLLLALTMEQHAKVWCRTSLLSRAFLRWRQRHGMYLLHALAAGNHSPPPVEMSTQAPSTVMSDPREGNSLPIPSLDISSTAHAPATASIPASASPTLSDTVITPGTTVPSVPCESTNTDCGVCLGPQKSVENLTEKSTTVQPTTIPSGIPLQIVNTENMEAGTVPISSANMNKKTSDHRNMLKRLISQCDRLASERVKRKTFMFWRDVRLLLRQQVQELIHRFTLRQQRQCWLLWKWRLTAHLLRRRREAADEQCYAYIEEKKDFLKQCAFSCWKQAYMVRRFRRRTCGLRVLSMWRRHNLFNRHARGAALPLISVRALVLRCLLHWRLARLCRVADRRFMRGFLLRLRERLSLRAAERQQVAMATYAWGVFVCWRVFKKWRVVWASHRCLAAAAARKDRRTTARLLKKWRLATMRRALGAAKQDATRRVLWGRWRQRAEMQWHWRRQQERHAEAAYYERLLRGTWRRWRNRHEKTLRQRQTQEVITWFAAKGHGNTSLGVNCSFPASIGSPHNTTINTSVPQCRVEKRDHYVSFGELKCSPPRKDPLAVLRAERRLLHEMNSTQWQSMAHSRLFNNSNNSNTTNIRDRHHQEKQQHDKDSYWKSKVEDDMTVIMMPSDVEGDNSPSCDNSRI